MFASFESRKLESRFVGSMDLLDLVFILPSFGILIVFVLDCESCGLDGRPYFQLHLTNPITFLYLTLFVLKPK